MLTFLNNLLARKRLEGASTVEAASKRLSSSQACLLPVLLLASSLGATPPNVILVVTDDQGYGDLGAHGNPVLETAQMDRLHGESLRLTDYHVDPTCSPTRAALMTGRYSTRTGVWHTLAGRDRMAAEELTMAEIFREAGYRTGFFGKWHLGDAYPLRPEDQGFEHVLRHRAGGLGQTPDIWGNDYFDDTFLLNGDEVRFRGHCTDVWFDNALDFIERNRERPFFAYISTNAPHAPFRARPEDAQKYLDQGVTEERAHFFGMIEHIDRRLGELRERLEALGLAENTILVFTTDNGTARGDFNAGMRGRKGSHYDGGHRVPFFFHFPAGGFDEGRAVDTITAHIDILPTLAELCGIELPENPRGPRDGRSLLPLFEGASDWPDRVLFMHSQRVDRPIQWRRTAVMTDRWRLLTGRELYDMAADPGQQRNVAADNPEVFERLRVAYLDWWGSLQPVMAQTVYPVAGHEAGEVLRLTAFDWTVAVSKIPWKQSMVRELPQTNGSWEVEFAESGRYRFTLRHAPERAALPLRAERARIEVDGQGAEVPVSPGTTSAPIEMDVKAGPATVRSFLETADESRGAFFLDIERVPDARAGVVGWEGYEITTHPQSGRWHG